jgi:uncharacterized phage-associated protein
MHRHLSLDAFINVWIQAGMEYGTSDVVAYLLHRRLMKPIKVMLLAFLAQYEVESNVVYEYRYGGRPLTRAEFYIWTHGPTSDEVYDALDALDPDLVSTELGLMMTWPGPPPDLPKPVAARLDEVVAKYGGWKPWQLERHVKKMLGLDIPEKMSDYMGWLLYSYLRAEDYTLMHKDLTS